MITIKKVLSGIMRKINSIADYIVGQGQIDVWTYRKYKSGVAECWMCWRGTLTPYTTGMLDGADNGFTKTWVLPFAFKERYSKVATVQVGSGIGIVCSGSLNDTLTEVCLHWASNTTGQSTVNMHIRGRWK